MAVLSWPSGLVPNRVEWSLQSNTQIFDSPLNASMQTLALPGDRWTGVLTFDNLIGEPALALTAFLARLRGRAGRFYCKPWHHYTPSGSAAGTPLCNGITTAGAVTLVTDGWAANQAEVLKAGDFIQVGNQLRMVVITAAADALGNATLTLDAPLRANVADNTAVIVNSPTCVMALVDNGAARWITTPGHIYAISIPVIEALDI